MTGAAKPVMKHGPSVRVVRQGDGAVILSSPHPIHRGSVTFNKAIRRWVAIVDTAPAASPLTATFPPRDYLRAVQWVGEHVGEMYRRDMRSRFTGPQRLAMGRNLCPAHVPCRDKDSCPIAAPDHSHLCRAVPESPYTIYCPDHDRGRL